MLQQMALIIAQEHLSCARMRGGSIYEAIVRHPILHTRATSMDLAETHATRRAIALLKASASHMYCR